MFKKVASNTLFQLLAKFVAAGLTFLTTILIIRLGSPELYGDLTKSLSLIAIGFTAIDFGLNAEAVRSMKGNQAAKLNVLSATFHARFYLSLVSILIINLVVHVLPGGYTPEIKSVFWIGSLGIIFQGIYNSANVWFQRHLEYWKTSLTTILGTVAGTLLTYLAITRSPNLFSLLSASTLGLAFMAVSSLFFIPRLILPNLFSNSKSGLTLLKHSFLLGLILILSIVASKVDTIILGISRSSAEVGQYGLAYRIFDVLLVFPIFVMNAVYPLLIDSSAAVKKKLIRNTSLAMFVFSLVIAVIAVIASPLIILIRPGLELSITSLKILALSLPLFYLTAPLMWQLIEARLEKSLLFVYAFAAVFNAITNIVFTPQYGAFSSALLTGLTELLILLGLIFVRRRYLFQQTL